MAQSIDVEKARKALTECGYTVDAISQINEGSNHYVFDVTLVSQLSVNSPESEKQKKGFHRKIKTLCLAVHFPLEGKHIFSV